jgi:hypothetical protein
MPVSYSYREALLWAEQIHRTQLQLILPLVVAGAPSEPCGDD